MRMGGALYLEGASTTTLTRSVFVGNVAGRNGGIIHVIDAGTLLILQDSVIANHTNATPSTTAVNFDASAGTRSSDYRLISADDTADDFRAKAVGR